MILKTDKLIVRNGKKGLEAHILKNILLVIYLYDVVKLG